MLDSFSWRIPNREFQKHPTHCLLADTTSQTERQTAGRGWPPHQTSLCPLRDESLKNWQNGNNNNSTKVQPAEGSVCMVTTGHGLHDCRLVDRGLSVYGDYGTWAAWLSFGRQRAQCVWWLWDMGCMTVVRFQIGTQTVMSPSHPKVLKAHKAPNQWHCPPS